MSSIDGTAPEQPTSAEAAPSWELVCTEMNDDQIVVSTKCLVVPGGWIYRCTVHGKDGPSFVAMTVVQDPEVAARLKELADIRAELQKRLEGAT